MSVENNGLKKKTYTITEDVPAVVEPVAEDIQEDAIEEVEEEREEQDPVEMVADDAEGEAEEAQDAEDVITLEGEALNAEERQYQGAPAWVKDLRKAHREALKQNRELKKRLESTETASTTGTTVPALGKKPELEDFDYETDKYEEALSVWFERKREQEQAVKRQKDEQEAADNAWQQELNRYETLKTQLKVPDFDDAENNVLDAFSQTQQGIIVSAAENPAVVVYALGKNEAKLKELAAIKDPVKFTAAITRLEATKLKVTKRAAPPPPEKLVSNKGPGGGNAMDNQLERLRRDAERTGDYTKVNDYKRQNRK